MSTTVTFKRGTTYSATVTYTPAAGGPANLLTTTVTSDIIDAGDIVYPCTITMAGVIAPSSKSDLSCLTTLAASLDPGRYVA